MQEFGDDWTITKIDILTKYANAYLKIMNTRKYFKLIYFDGFAGTGHIDLNKEHRIEGSVTKILSINEPRQFDYYYFVELDSKKAQLLRSNIKKEFPAKSRRCFIVEDDCNNRLLTMAKFLERDENRNYRTLAFIDPKGMQVNHSSLEAFKDIQGVDAWILIPTGIGTNRLLKKDGKISDSWINRISNHLGISEKEIRNTFYSINPQGNLFGDIEMIKEKSAIDLVIKLYAEKLNTIWKYISNPIALKNRSNSTMFHFLLVSNNKNAKKIANDIIKNN